MKADRNGTRSERARADMGWKSPAERKGDGKAHVACHTCRFFFLKDLPSRDGGASNSSPYCGHPHAGGEYGHPTRASAVSNRWELAP